MFWKLIAWIVTRPSVTDWFIERAKANPWFDLHGYIERGWIFNATEDSRGNRLPRNWAMQLLPSLRLHHILRADNDRHLHDHPFKARTIILRGWYEEERLAVDLFPWDACDQRRYPDGTIRNVFLREQGYTGPILFGQFHRISEVPEGGVWTLFIHWSKLGEWGFLVDGEKVPAREYIGEERP